MYKLEDRRRRMAAGETSPLRHGVFPTTSWSDILAAGRQSPGSGEALAKLCAAYWSPTYAYIRRRGFPRESAEDLTQQFFAHVLESGFLSGAQRERGKFRSRSEEHTSELQSLRH